MVSDSCWVKLGSPSVFLRRGENVYAAELLDSLFTTDSTGTVDIHGMIETGNAPSAITYRRLSGFLGVKISDNDFAPSSHIAGCGFPIPDASGNDSNLSLSISFMVTSSFNLKGFWRTPKSATDFYTVYLKLALGPSSAPLEHGYNAHNTHHGKSDENGIVVCLEQIGNHNRKYKSQKTLRSQALLLLCQYIPAERPVSGTRGIRPEHADSAALNQPAEHHKYPGVDAKRRKPATDSQHHRQNRSR